MYYVYTLYIYIYHEVSHELLQHGASERGNEWKMFSENCFARISAMALAHLKVNLAILESEASQLVLKGIIPIRGFSSLSNPLPNQYAQKNGVNQKSVCPFFGHANSKPDPLHESQCHSQKERHPLSRYHSPHQTPCLSGLQKWAWQWVNRHMQSQ